MTIRTHSELRKLALAYHHGWISRDQYLEIRQAYLKFVTDGKTPEAIDPKRIAPPKMESEPQPDIPLLVRFNKSQWVIPALIIVATTLLLLILAGTYLGKTATPPTKKASIVPNNNNIIEKSDTAKKPPIVMTNEQHFNDFMTKNFINRRTWDASTLNSLKLKWLGLTHEQQKFVSTTKTFQDFQSALIEQIIDERQLNNIVPSDYELTLMTIAKNMGITNAIPPSFIGR